MPNITPPNSGRSSADIIWYVERKYNCRAHLLSIGQWELYITSGGKESKLVTPSRPQKYTHDVSTTALPYIKLYTINFQFMPSKIALCSVTWPKYLPTHQYIQAKTSRLANRLCSSWYHSANSKTGNQEGARLRQVAELPLTTKGMDRKSNTLPPYIELGTRRLMYVS